MMRAQSGVGFSGGGIGLKSSGVLAQSAVPASVTGTLSETTLATIAIPAGAMGVNGLVRVTADFSNTNSANSKIFTVRLGGQSFYSATVTTTAVFGCQARAMNRGALNSQIGGVQTVGSGGFGSTSTASASLSVDTSQAQNLTITGTLTNTSETITLAAYTVEILNP